LEEEKKEREKLKKEQNGKRKGNICVREEERNEQTD
jgi:hypothetical protein